MKTKELYNTMSELDLEKMNILAFDASGSTCSAAVFSGGKTVASVYTNSGLTHSRTLLPAIKNVLENAGITPEKLDAVTVTVGPGSFTGVKIGVATAKGIAFPDRKPCFAVSSLAALAFGAKVFDGIICPVCDARRGMFYNALFSCEDGKITRLTPDRQISGDDLIAEIRDKNAVIIGDGTLLFRTLCEKDAVKIRISSEIISYIRAESILEAVGAGMFENKTPKDLSAVYLRPPQAERERLERLENINKTEEQK